MRYLITISLLVILGHCYGGSFDLDTIDNWQVYNGNELVLAGYESSLDTAFEGTMKRSDLTALSVYFNHCVRYAEEFDVIVEIVDENGRKIMEKRFKAGSKMMIEKRQLGALTTKSITIRYREKRKNGTDRILGRIRFL
jgi:hypothetical protein